MEKHFGKAIVRDSGGRATPRLLSLRTQRDMNNRLSWPVIRTCFKAPGLPKIIFTVHCYDERPEFVLG